MRTSCNLTPFYECLLDRTLRCRWLSQSVCQLSIQIHHHSTNFTTFILCGTLPTVSSFYCSHFHNTSVLFLVETVHNPASQTKSLFLSFHFYTRNIILAQFVIVISHQSTTHNIQTLLSLNTPLAYLSHLDHTLQIISISF